MARGRGAWWPDVVSLPFLAPFLCMTLRTLIAWSAAGGRDGPGTFCRPLQRGGPEGVLVP